LTTLIGVPAVQVAAEPRGVEPDDLILVLHLMALEAEEAKACCGRASSLLLTPTGAPGLRFSKPLPAR
jgi:hypothetical protein